MSHPRAASAWGARGAPGGQVAAGIFHGEVRGGHHHHPGLRARRGKPKRDATSRNNDQSKQTCSQHFADFSRKSPHITQNSADFHKNPQTSNDFCGIWWKFAEFYAICRDFCEKSAKFCEHFCFDWSLFRLVTSRSKSEAKSCSNACAVHWRGVLSSIRIGTFVYGFC